jgi:signal transduction histidine kinase
MHARAFKRRSLRLPRFRVHTSLASKLLLGCLVFTVLVIAGVSGFLLVSRSQQTNTAALSNADNRAGVALQLLPRIIEPEAQYAATDVAGLDSMQLALSGQSPASAVAQEFVSKRVLAVPGLDVVILDAHGGVLYTTECDSAAGAGQTQPPHPATATCEAGKAPHVTTALVAVHDALAIAAKPACHAAAATIASSASLLAQCPAGVEGVELVGGSVPAFDVAVPVFNSQTGSYAPLGVVVYSSQLRTLFTRFGPLIGYTPVFLVTTGTPSVTRYTGGEYTPVTDTAPPLILSSTRAHSTTSGSDRYIAHAIYPVPRVGDVAGSFGPLQAPGGTAVSGYLGVEVPLSLFAAGTAQDERTIGQIAFTAIVVVCVLVLFFVDRFVRRPVARLERGVARIAAGDYGTDIPVTSRDELGRLATSVNRMREQIAGYIRHIDGSIERLQDVSSALTTTTGGVESLQDAVLRAAAAMAGHGGTATLYARRDNAFTASRGHGQPAPPTLDAHTAAAILRRNTVRNQVDGSHELAVPMFYQDRVNGALVVRSADGVADSDERALIALANNAAVALENTRMFEQEKDAVARLSELNQIKSDLLSTAQHELRTPVLAIRGQLELLTLAWSKWDDAAKMDIIHDIEISTRLLGELVETIVDFSLLNSDTLELRVVAVDVGKTVVAAAAEVRGHFKDGLPVELHVDVPPDTVVLADAQRFRQVIRSLLDNAVKFTPEGGRVSVLARPDAAAGKCRIDVIDNGIGIGPDSLPRVFDRFFQEDNSRTRRYGGMGMGLALVRRLCEAHGATVSAESEQGAGSRFSLLWPLATGAEQVVHEDDNFRFSEVALHR